MHNSCGKLRQTARFYKLTRRSGVKSSPETLSYLNHRVSVAGLEHSSAFQAFSGQKTNKDNYYATLNDFTDSGIACYGNGAAG